MNYQYLRMQQIAIAFAPTEASVLLSVSFTQENNLSVEHVFSNELAEFFQAPDRPLWYTLQVDARCEALHEQLRSSSSHRADVYHSSMLSSRSPTGGMLAAAAVASICTAAMPPQAAGQVPRYVSHLFLLELGWRRT